MKTFVETSQLCLMRPGLIHVHILFGDSLLLLVAYASQVFPKESRSKSVNCSLQV
ncbi:hypothetical protein BDV33DRAFT_166599 [Aspergillus novoparasiticus]|uniref:Uncharacterized protein n=1 Tax=Aspergillus novoparasiticus TaxID=986946 RepID=A0A5N6F3T7_9EURO|nr:hypothetical protein BDV33DRAFT_166599 [Aspergillus novoparasiticus]